MPGSEANGLQRIEHVVVLMLENRSFDHMLGYLRLEGGRADVDGLTEAMVNSHRGRARATRLLEDPGGMLHPAEAHALTDLQGRMLAVDQAAREQGHPAGQP